MENLCMKNEDRIKFSSADILNMSLRGADSEKIEAFISGEEKIGTRKIYYRQDFLEDLKANDSRLIKFKNFTNEGGWFLTPFDKEYPDLLKEIDNKPMIIYGIGDRSLLNKNCLAIIGTRNPSSYGRAMAEKFSYYLAERGLNIVSGLAYGIDSIAHRQALRAGGKTIAVLGSGPDRIYPESHFYLAGDIIKNGTIISEYPPATGPKRHHFIYRNRIISGLSRAILVVEAKRKSGTFITVKAGLDQGREIFCIPGNLDQIRSQGTNSLIRDGAGLVMEPGDILSAYPQINNKKIKDRSVSNLGIEEEKVYDKLSAGPLSADILSGILDLEISRVYSILTSLEWKGKIRPLEGGLYIKED